MLVVLDHVGKTYPNGVHALERHHLFDVGPGEITVAIVGGSGCGKSTLLRAGQRGLDTPSQGRVLLDGEPLSPQPHEKIGMIFQEPRLLPWLTVAGNVGFRSRAPASASET